MSGQLSLNTNSQHQNTNSQAPVAEAMTMSEIICFEHGSDTVQLYIGDSDQQDLDIKQLQSLRRDSAGLQRREKVRRRIDGVLPRRRLLQKWNRRMVKEAWIGRLGLITETLGVI
ncbi:hypothetical protein Vadar_015381 [Vaccinium darrowii]|uniref:Uncharacterized protein n=1 Tax=Vaccinium darrowii TaxID=229202 RepID=A0ACB7Y7H7_9ERIC|nr:hypothetical protein Vadar_015381 [Vaccinium darrowii]